MLYIRTAVGCTLFAFLQSSLLSIHNTYSQYNQVKCVWFHLTRNKNKKLSFLLGLYAWRINRL